MRYSADQKRESRLKILKGAGRGFRAQGFAGIGVDGLAKEAGVTSGAFYTHFASKADAFRSAATNGLIELREAVRDLQEKDPTHWLRKFAEFYMGFKRTCVLEESCALQTLTGEVARTDDKTKAAYEAELLLLVDAVATHLAKGTLHARRQTAWAILTLLSGGVTLSRATYRTETGQQIAKSIIDAVNELAK